MSSEVKNRPFAKIEAGHLQLALFNNIKESGHDRISVQLSKSYFDQRSQEWKTSSITVMPHEVSALKALLAAAETELMRPHLGPH